VIEVRVASEPNLADEWEGLRTVRVNMTGVTIDTDKEGYIRGLLFLYFQLLDENREYSRLLCLLLYAMGFAFISIPSLKIFVKIFGIFITVMSQGLRGVAN
jgi:hypothetical protein